MGRAVHLQIFSQSITPGVDQTTLSMFFIHNLGFTSQGTAHLTTQIEEDCLGCESRPEKHSMILMGDVNLAEIQKGAEIPPQLALKTLKGLQGSRKPGLDLWQLSHQIGHDQQKVASKQAGEAP